MILMKWLKTGRFENESERTNSESLYLDSFSQKRANESGWFEDESGRFKNESGLF
jgi:hypothetical protein